MNVTNIKQRFKNSIKRGTGETYLLMQSHPEIDFSESIIMASVKNFAYDGQCEGSRADYIFGLISMSGQRKKIRDAILKALATEQKDTWTLVQLFELAGLLAQQGDLDARQAIYDRFFSNHPHKADWAGYNDILKLDGIKGLIFIAEKIGRALEKNPDDWQDDTIIRRFEQDNPGIDAMQVLENASTDSRFIELYLTYVKRAIEDASNYKREKPIFKDVVEEILLSEGRYRLLRKRDDADLLLIAKQLLIEENLANREKLLTVFVKNKFPLDSRIILDLAKQESPQGSKISKTAVDVLTHLKSDDIRAFAIEQINTSKNPEHFTGILKSNYREGDAEILTKLAKRVRSDFKIESLMYDYVAIYDANETPECQGPLEALYNKSNCGIHRAAIVRILMDNNVLSEKIKSEIKFDSNTDIGKLTEER